MPSGRSFRFSFSSPERKMSPVLERVAETARHWGRREDLSPGDRYIALQMDHLASFLSRKPFPPGDDVDCLHVLSCRLCQRIGADRCRQENEACCMGFSTAA